MYWVLNIHFYQCGNYYLRLSMAMAFSGKFKKRNTSDIGLRGDLRSTTFGLLSFEAFLTGLGEEEAELGSEPGVFSCRAVRGVAGDFFWGTSEVPALLVKMSRKENQLIGGS